MLDVPSPTPGPIVGNGKLLLLHAALWPEGPRLGVNPVRYITGVLGYMLKSSEGGVSPLGLLSPLSLALHPPATPALIARVEVLLRVIGLSAAAGVSRAGPLCDEGRRHGPRRRGWRRGRCPGRPSAAAAPAPGPRQQRGLGARQQQQPAEAVAAGWPAGVFMSGRGVSQQHGGLPDQRRHRLRSRGWAHRAAALRQR